jgi:hypothetical protein
MLLHAGPGSVVLEVEQVLHIPSQRSHPGMEVRALKVAAIWGSPDVESGEAR